MSKNVQGSEDGRREEPSLDSRYGEIGISAVAAAVQFKSKAKNPTYAPSDSHSSSAPLAMGRDLT
jgi:hypothetical protein